MGSKAEKRWEATISVWKEDDHRWWWKIWRSFHPQIYVRNTAHCRTRKIAYEDARRVLKRLNLVEVKT